MEENNLIKISLKNKIISLKITDFDTDIDVDDLIKIDYHNILGEILTFSVIMNRIGNFRAETEELVEIAKVEVEIKKAELSEYYRMKLRKRKGENQWSYPTIAEVDNAVIQDKVHQAVRKKYLRLKKEHGYIESLYWAANSKDNKLNKISEKLRPEEFEKEILEGNINGIMIKCHEKLIK